MAGTPTACDSTPTTPHAFVAALPRHRWYLDWGVVWALLIGCVRPDSGPESKMRGLASALDELGFHSRLELIRPGRSAPGRTAALLEQVALTPPPGRGVVLLRSHWSLPRSLGALRRLRAAGHLVVIEVPTPVAAGMREIRGAPRSLGSKAGRLLTETLWTPLAWQGADLVVQYAPDAPPWGMLARNRRLTLTNGVDVATRPISAGWVDRTGLTFVCAGALGPWHGLDRLVLGLASSAENSRLLVVGDGPELPKLQALATRLAVSDRVMFLGSLGGVELDRVMHQADVGVASLAEHRRGGAALSPLKTRDYLARGLPVLFAGDDPDLRSDPPFTMRVAADDSTVDVAHVAAWLEGLRRQARSRQEGFGGAGGPAAIREFAVAQLQWRARVAAILTALGVGLDL